jgi:hypothetical protein
MKAMTGATVNGRGWTANWFWAFTGMTGTAKVVWGAAGGVAMVPDAGTIPGAGNMGSE